jgi:hypothetical protein
VKRSEAVYAGRWEVMYLRLGNFTTEISPTDMVTQEQ